MSDLIIHLVFCFFVHPKQSKRISLWTSMQIDTILTETNRLWFHRIHLYEKFIFQSVPPNVSAVDLIILSFQR